MNAKKRSFRELISNSERELMSPEREREYNELLAYLSFFASAVWKISSTSDTHPAQTIVKITGEFGKSKALVGLRQAVNDTVEYMSDWSAEARSIFDDALIAAGITTTTEIARRYASAYKRIVRHIYPDVKQANPGDTVRVFLGFLSPTEHLGKIYPNMTFEIREGARTVGRGRVIRILELEESATRSNQKNPRRPI